jgi:hypothetical protein
VIIMGINIERANDLCIASLLETSNVIFLLLALKDIC